MHKIAQKKYKVNILKIKKKKISDKSSKKCKYRVATVQIWDTEKFTGLELQKKYRISFPHTEPFTEQIWRFTEIIQNFFSTYRIIYRKNMAIYRNTTEFLIDLQNRLQNKLGDFKKKY